MKTSKVDIADLNLFLLRSKTSRYFIEKKKNNTVYFFFLLQEVPTSYELWVIPWGEAPSSRTGLPGLGCFGVKPCRGCINGSRLYRNSNFVSPDSIRLTLSKLLGIWVFLICLGFVVVGSEEFVSWKLKEHLSLGLPWIEKMMILVGIFQGLLIRAWIYEMLSRLVISALLTFSEGKSPPANKSAK